MRATVAPIDAGARDEVWVIKLMINPANIINNVKKLCKVCKRNRSFRQTPSRQQLLTP
jgi:hypothetical protein